MVWALPVSLATTQGIEILIEISDKRVVNDFYQYINSFFSSSY